MKEALKKCHAMQFMGSDSNALIHVKNDLNKGAGDRLTFGIRQQLQGAGVSGDATLEGSEEALVTYTQNLTINQLRHAVRSAGKMSEQRVPFSVRNEARDGLADWWADRWDTWFFNQITGNTGVVDEKYFGFNTLAAPDAAHMVFPGAAIAEASLSATTAFRFSLALIDKARERAALAVNTFRPISVDGQKRYVAFLHPYQVTSLRQSTASTQWSDIHLAALSARDSSDNPLYSGALGIYNDTVLHVSTRIPIVAGAAAGTAARAVFCGAQAACMGWGQGYGKSSMDWNEELFDYKNKLGVEAGCIGGIVKTRFNGSDFAAITMSTYEVAS